MQRVSGDFCDACKRWGLPRGHRLFERVNLSHGPPIVRIEDPAPQVNHDGDENQHDEARNGGAQNAGEFFHTARVAASIL